MSRSLFNRTRLLERFLCVVPFAASLAAAGSCAEESTQPPAAAAAEGLSDSAEARGRIEAIRSRFPDAIGAVAIDRFEAARDGAIRPVLSPSDSREQKVATVELPRDAAGPVRVTDDASAFCATFHLDGTGGSSARAAGGIVLYPGALPGADVLHRVVPGGTEDFVYFEEEPARKELRYQLDMGGIAGLRLVSNSLEMLDRGGVPRLRVAPPYLVDARGRRSEVTIAVEGCTVDTSPRGPWGRAVTEPGAGTCAVTVSFQHVSAVYPVLVDPFWASTKNAMANRTRHTMTLLDPFSTASRVLLAGGFDNGVALSSAELYDPLSRRFAAAGSMTGARGAHTATLLTTITDTAGESPVLIAGGSDTAGGMPLGSLEIYDPATDTFVLDPPDMTNPRFNHTATLFDDNTVLLAGGISPPLNQPTNTATVYTFMGLTSMPISTRVNTPNMAASRMGHTASRLRDGHVLIAGGFVVAGTALQSAEIFDQTGFLPVQPSTGLSSVMAAPRGFHSATELASKDVLLAGGANQATGGVVSNTADVFRYDPPTEQGFQSLPTAMVSARGRHTATLLATGQVLIAGGFSGLSALTSVEIFTPQPPDFDTLALSPMVPLLARGDHAALLVHAGNPDVGELSELGGRTVLVTGGSASSAANAPGLSTAQILLRLNGEACRQGLECVSGFCADDVCCDQACNELCRACTVAKKAPNTLPDGVCGPASQGSDLQVECINEVETHSQCKGDGTWEVNANTIVCTPGFCAGNRCATVCDAVTPCSDAGWCDYTAGSGAGGGGGASGAGGSGAAGAGGGLENPGEKV